MRGEGVLRDCSQPRTLPGRRTLNGCKMKRNLDNVVLIDIDSEGFDNVIIIDVPESLQRKIRGSSVSRKGKEIKFHGVISIDDDENADYPEMGRDSGGDLESDTSSSKSCPTSDYGNKSVDLNDDGCHVVQEKNFASRVSRSKQVFGKEPCESCYGLSESSSSDDDGFVCEVMEGSSGQLHKEWEKASLKRKSNVHKGKYGLDDHASPSCLNKNGTQNVDAEVGERDKLPGNTAFFCDTKNSDCKKQNFSTFVSTADGDSGTASLNHGMKRPFVESDQKVDQEGSCNDGQSPQGQCLCTNQCESDKPYYHRRDCYMDKQQNIFGEHFNFHGSNWNFHCRNTAFEDEEASLRKSRKSSEAHDYDDRVVPSDIYKELSQATSSCSSSPRKSRHTRVGFMEKDKPIFGKPLVSNSQPSYETRAECGVAPSTNNVGAVFEESFLFKTPSSGMPEVCNENVDRQDTEKPDTEVVSLCRTQCAERESKKGNPCLAEIKGQVSANDQLDNGVKPIHAQGVSITPAVEEDIINKREKLKETNEYKLAMEEEWASRQRQLQIQAEESRRLRKKKRAESMRLLDMERRQKQRLEEIRETQKKDEENMNVKEQLRVEVRKELYKLETTCVDMTSLLRALGIHVGGNFHPLSEEVHAAYKRALLTFHPDRASKTDIRQQVEAEEKFKLISRMKGKFLFTTFH